MPQIYDMGPTALLPLRAEDFFALKIRRLRPGLNLQTWVLKASTLPLDHRSRYIYTYTHIYISVLDWEENSLYELNQTVRNVLDKTAEYTIRTRLECNVYVPAI